MASPDQTCVITTLNNNLAELITKCTKGSINKTDLTSVIEGNNKKLAELFVPIREIHGETELAQIESTVDPTTMSIIKYLLENAYKNCEREVNKVMLLYKDQKEHLERYREYTDDRFFKLETKIDTLENANTELTKRAQTAETKAKALEQELLTSNANIDELEQNKRNTHLVINNLRPDSGTDVDAFISLCKDKIKLESSVTDIIKENIVKVNRIFPKNPSGSPDPSKPKPLLVKFSNERFKEMVFRKKKALKNSGIIITEFLTPARSALLKKCSENIKVNKSIWTDNGRILVKLQDQSEIVHIANNNDLTKFIEEKFPHQPTRV